MGFDLLLLMFPKQIWDFGLAYYSFTLPSLYLGQARWKSISLHSFFITYCIKRLQVEMYVWFSSRAIKLSTKSKLEFFLIKLTATTWLLSPFPFPPGVLPYENVGGAR